MKSLTIIIIAICFVVSLANAQWPRNQTVVDGEYFINADPGEGLGQHINGNYGTWEVTVNVPNLNLPVGSKAYVRFKSSNGKWSAPRAIKREPVFANRGATIEYAEYYVNSDPGRENGISLPNPQLGNYTLQNPRLRRGDRVYFRLRDSFGRWSDSRPAQFTFKNIDSAWYYIKRRPSGQTNPVPMNVSAPNESSAVFTATATIPVINTFDTVLVQFRTNDRFLSPWARTIYTGPPVEVTEGAGIPKVFALHHNYPNPFNPTTTIKYDLPQESLVTLRLYDILGREVAALVNEQQEAGYKQTTWDAAGFASGVYFYRLQVGDPSTPLGTWFVETKKLLLLR